MSLEHTIKSILDTVVLISAQNDQILTRMETIDKRLSGMEVKMAQVERWVSLENANFQIGGVNA